MIKPSSNKIGLKWKLNILWEAQVSEPSWKWRREWANMTRVVNKIVLWEECDIGISYITTSYTNLVPGSQIEIWVNTSSVWVYRMLDLVSHWYKVLKSWVYKVELNLPVQGAGLTDVTIHVLKNGSNIPTNTVLQFTNSWNDFITVAWTGYILLQWNDIVTFYITFNWAPTVDVLWLDNLYGSNILVVKQ